MVGYTFIPGRRSGAEVRSGASRRALRALLSTRISCPEERNVEPSVSETDCQLFGHPSRDCRLGRGITLDFLRDDHARRSSDIPVCGRSFRFLLAELCGLETLRLGGGEGVRQTGGHLPVQLDRCLRWSAVSESIPPKRSLLADGSVQPLGQEVSASYRVADSPYAESHLPMPSSTRARNKWLLLFPAFSPVPIRSSPWRCPRTIGTSLPAISVF